MKRSRVFRGVTSVLLLIECVILGLTIAMFSFASFINIALGVETSKLVLKDGVTSEEDVEKPQYFKSKFAKDINNPTEEEIAAKNEAVAAFVELEEEEGSVLLKNDKNALPLSADEIKNVNLFGRSTVNPYTKSNSDGGSGRT